MEIPGALWGYTVAVSTARHTHHRDLLIGSLVPEPEFCLSERDEATNIRQHKRLEPINKPMLY